MSEKSRTALRTVETSSYPCFRVFQQSGSGRKLFTVLVSWPLTRERSAVRVRTGLPSQCIHMPVRLYTRSRSCSLNRVPQTANHTGNKLGTEHNPKTKSNRAYQHLAKSLRSKDGLKLPSAHNPKDVGSNPTVARMIAEREYIEALFLFSVMSAMQWTSAVSWAGSR